MKKIALFFALFALLPLLIVGCNPPQNKNAQKKDGADGACTCGHDHGTEGHSSDAGHDHADHDHADHDHAGDDHAGHDHAETPTE